MELTDFWFGISLLLLKNERNYRYLCAEDNGLVKRGKVMVQAKSEACWAGGGHGHGVLAELTPKKGQATLQLPGGRAARMGPGQARMQARRARAQKVLV